MECHFLTVADLYKVTICLFVDGFLAIFTTQAKRAPAHGIAGRDELGPFFKQVRDEKLTTVYSRQSCFSICKSGQAML